MLTFVAVVSTLGLITSTANIGLLVLLVAVAKASVTKESAE